MNQSYIKLRAYRRDDLSWLCLLLNQVSARISLGEFPAPLAEEQIHQRFSNPTSSHFQYMAENQAGQLLGFFDITLTFKDRRGQLRWLFAPHPEEIQTRTGDSSADPITEPKLPSPLEESLRELLRRLFQEMNLNKCIVQIPAFQDPDLAILQRAGFTQEAVLRDEVFYEGRYHDALLLGLLREELQNLKTPDVGFPRVD